MSKRKLVICSTLNQMTNYLIINKLKTEIDVVYNITQTKVGKRQGLFSHINNEKWDKSLSDIIESKSIDIKIEEIDVSQNNEFIEVEESFEDLEMKLSSEKKLIWNITGGQRNVLLGIIKFLKSRKKQEGYEDEIIYIEGNSNRAIYLDTDLNKIDGEEFDYSKSDINIEEALALAGFNVENLGENLLDNKLKIYSEKYAIYNKLEKNYEDILKTLFKLNKSPDTQTIDEIKSEYEKEIKQLFKRDIGKKNIEGWIDKSGINTIYSDELKRYITAKINKSKDDEKVQKSFLEKIALKKYQIDKIIEVADKIKIDENIREEFIKKISDLGGFNTNKFGYILEMMVVEKVLRTIKNNNYITDVRHSINVKHEDGKFCEFDVLLLNKYGQLLVLECKSGSMSADVGKARKYTTYVTAGVYGLPVMISPFTSISLRNLSKSASDALNAAERATIDVWKINEVIDKIKSFIGEGE